MAVRLILICTIVLVLTGYTIHSQPMNGDPRQVNQLQEAKLKVDKLVSLLDGTIQKIDARSIYLRQLEKSIQDMENQIRRLHSLLSSMKGGPSTSDVRISELEAEVKMLWAASRKNNFDLHALEAKARDIEDTGKALASEVEKMSDVVTENWIQIQRLEQVREFNSRRQLRSTACTFLKFLNNLSEERLGGVLSRVVSCALELFRRALKQLKCLWRIFTEYHHKLQGTVKYEMERTKLTAAVANKEVVFFVASALITFPVLGAWIWLKP